MGIKVGYLIPIFIFFFELALLENTFIPGFKPRWDIPNFKRGLPKIIMFVGVGGFYGGTVFLFLKQKMLNIAFF